MPTHCGDPELSSDIHQTVFVNSPKQSTPAKFCVPRVLSFAALEVGLCEGHSNFHPFMNFFAHAFFAPVPFSAAILPWLSLALKRPT
jgi:hypothetical protein